MLPFSMPPPIMESIEQANGILPFFCISASVFTVLPHTGLVVKIKIKSCNLRDFQFVNELILSIKLFAYHIKNNFGEYILNLITILMN